MPLADIFTPNSRVLAYVIDGVIDVFSIGPFY